MMLASFVLSLAIAPPPATVWRVGAGRTLTTIQQAITLAQDGDLILVDTGTYPAIDVDGKSIAILADIPITPFRILLPQSGPAVRVRNLAAGQSFTMQGCILHVDSGTSPSLSFEQCTGAVRVLDLQLDTVVDLPSATMVAVIDIRGCAAVSLENVRMTSSTRRNGETSPGVPVANGIDRGIAALWMEASNVRLTRCTLTGYDNRTGPPAGRFGGDGVRMLGAGSLRIDGSPTRIVGGVGGEFGGNALHHLGAGMTDVLSCAVDTNAFVPGAAPNPGGYLAVRHDRGQVAPGVERFIPACIFEAAGFVTSSSRCTIGMGCDLEISSFLPRGYWLFLGEPGHGRVPGIVHTLWLDPGAPLHLLSAGLLGQPAIARVPVTVPLLVDLIGLQLAGQAVLGAPVGGGGPQFAFTTASNFTLVP